MGCDPAPLPEAEALARALARQGCTVTHAGPGRQALEAAGREPYLLAFLDVHARPSPGLQLLRDLRHRAPDLRAAVLSAAPDLASALDFFRLGAFDYLTKPVTPTTLHAVLRRARAAAEERRGETLDLLQALAPGLVHALRNPLSGILASTQLLVQHLGAEARAGRYLHILRDEARQLEELLARLAEFGRLRGEDGGEAVEVGSLLRQMAREFAPACGTQGVRLVVRGAAQPVWARGSPSRVLRSCRELIRNALDAMPRGGTLTVTCRVAWDPGPRIELEFADSGPGMTPESRRRGFELFFSTRPRTLGVGLPLALATARACGGTVRLAPPGPRGSRVILELPSVPAPLPSAPGPPHP